MPDFSFDNTHEGHRGLSRVLTPFRRLLTRLLRPIFVRQAAAFAELGAKIEQVAAGLTDLTKRQQQLTDGLGGLIQRQERLEAFECDGTALGRRLAALEDRIEALLSHAGATTPEAGPSAVIPFSKSA